MRDLKRTKAQLSREAIERLYIAMRHLFIRGSYKPLGVSGEAMIEALQALEPEIYGSVNDPEKVELDGLFYVFQRLPHGIEECRYIKLISREGFETSNFPSIIPAKRRRDCYRIDEETRNVVLKKLVRDGWLERCGESCYQICNYSEQQISRLKVSRVHEEIFQMELAFTQCEQEPLQFEFLLKEMEKILF